MKFAHLLSILAICFFSFSFPSSQKPIDAFQANQQQPPYLITDSPWADSVIAQMTMDEKIGQLFNVAAYSNKGEQHTKEILNQIEKYHIGGLTFFQGSPHRQAKLTNLYQDSSEIPLMIAFDGEWGLSMRIDSSMKYPWAMTLGAIQDDSLIYQMGRQLARQFKRIGVNVNFAPAVDVNNNPNNPVINARSFGEQPENVAQKGIAYMKGLQDGKVVACAKHFPGHGDTDTDSHHSLPLIEHSKARMDSVELPPFKALIDAGVGAVMTAHLNLPNYTKIKKIPSSLSPSVVDTLLKKELGFKGLVFTDALNMTGVSTYNTSEKTDLQALVAGNDILLLSRNVGKAVKAIKAGIANGKLSAEKITHAAHKVLKVKEWLGLDKYQPVELKNLYSDLNKPAYQQLNRKLTEKSLTILRNEKNIIPIRELKGKRIVSLALAKEKISYRPFQKALNRYAQVDTMHYEKLPVMKQKALMDTLLTYDHIIVSLHQSNDNPWVDYNLDNEFKNFLNILRLKKDIIIDVFTNAYSLQNFLAASYAPGLILSYQNSDIAQELSAQLIFGGIKANGRLPVSVSNTMKAGMGLLSDNPMRLKYSMPEEVGIQSEDLAAVDSIVLEGIEKRAYPGAQVYIAKSGNVIYNKSFGNHTYSRMNPVENSDLYDLASVTKIASTLLAIMDLDSRGKLTLDDRLGKHLKMTRGTVYEDLKLREVLAHQAGLKAWVPFYMNTLHHGMPRFDLYSKDSTKDFPVKVADHLFINKSYKDTIFNRLLYHTKVSEKKEYRYSDIGYYFLKGLVEQKLGEAIDQYNEEHFYSPLGMNRTAFNPLNKFPLTAITPTENDEYFRGQLIHGYVHDPGAAMLGGVGGHAGLFSNANDLGKLMQLYLQYGQYAKKNYIDSAVIDEYTSCQFCSDSVLHKDENRRGAGFDKPAYHGEPGPTCDCISYESFGHSGFTGTYAWVDPEEKLVYIFLSNRVYPTAKNNKLVSMNIRTRIQEKIYEALSPSSGNQNKAALIKDSL